MNNPNINVCGFGKMVTINTVIRSKLLIKKKDHPFTQDGLSCYFILFKISSLISFTTE